MSVFRRPWHQYASFAVLLVCVSVVGLLVYPAPSPPLVHPVGPPGPIPLTASDFVLAEYYFAPEQYDLGKARYHYTEAIKASSTEHVLAWYQLARIDFLEGKFDAALHKLDTQLEYFGDEIPNVYYMKGLVYGFRADWYGNEVDWERAEANFLQFIEYMPTSPWARIDLAWIYFSQGDFASMLAVLDPIYEAEQSNPWYLNMYALALMNTGEVAEAYKLFVRVEALVPTLTPADWALVYPDNNPADWAQGLEEFQVVVARNTKVAKSRLNQ